MASRTRFGSARTGWAGKGAPQIKQLWNKQVSLVKVLWQYYGREEATWKPEATMRAQYPQLFSSGNNFEDEILLGEGGGGGGGGGGGEL